MLVANKTFKLKHGGVSVLNEIIFQIAENFKIFLKLLLSDNFQENFSF